MERYLSRNDSSRRQTMDVPEFDRANPHVLAANIDDEILRLRRMTADPANDPNKSPQERMRYMIDAPGHDVSSRGSNGSDVPRASIGQNTEYLAYKSHKEKLSSWVSPSTNDCSAPKNLYQGSANKMTQK